MMKKIMVTTIMVLAVFFLGGCAETEQEVRTELVQEVVFDNEYDDLLELPDTENDIVKLYRQEVSNRNINVEEKEESFNTEEELTLLKEKGYEIANHKGLVVKYDSLYKKVRDYYYPIVFKDKDSIIILYTTEYGTFDYEEVDGQNRALKSFYGNVHYDPQELLEVLENNSASAVLYNFSTGEIERWKLGEKIQSFWVPEQSIYGGKSFWIGHLFRNGSDVYALSKDSVCKIATGVSKIIVCDYKYNSDAWSQPLFLMKDGSLKAYVEWGTEKGDDPELLKEPFYEGSYR